MVRPLTEQEALNALREAGVIEAASITALGEGWNWERSRTSKAIIRWEDAGRINREKGTARKIIIRMREGTGNGTANGNGNTGNGKRKAGTGGTASTGKRKAGTKGTVNGVGPVHEHKAGTNGTVNGNGTTVHESAAVHGPAVHDPIPASAVPASDRDPAPATIPALKVDWLTLLRSLASILAAAILFLAALDLGGSGLVMNARYAASLGHSGEGATIQAMIGIAIEAIALVLLSAGYLLWSNGHRRFAVIAWLIWPFMIGLSLMNTIGFSATNISDALARRSAIVTKTSNAAIKVSNAASDLKKWRKDRDAITEARSVEEIKLELVRNRKKVDRIDRDAFEATVGCTLLTADITKACDAVLSLVQAMAQAKRRDDVTKKIDDAEKPQRAPAAENKQEGTPAAEGNQESTTITSADPQAEMVPKLVKWITRGWIEPSSDDAVMLRILGLTVPPVLAGLFLMFASVLLAPARTTSHD